MGSNSKVVLINSYLKLDLCLFFSREPARYGYGLGHLDTSTRPSTVSLISYRIHSYQQRLFFSLFGSSHI